MTLTINPAVVTAHARAWIGTPFHRRAARRWVGADCVGLIRGIYSDVSGVNVTPPPFVEDWASAPISPIIEAGDRYLTPAPEVGVYAPGDVVAFCVGSPDIVHVGVLNSTPENARPMVIHACERRGVIESRTPWRIAGHWRFPLGDGCEPGRLSLPESDLIAIVQEDAEGHFYTVQDVLDATPLSRSVYYPTAAAALDAIPPVISSVERV